MIAPLRMAFQALAANKLRSSLTMLGNIIGVTCVVALINIGNSGREKMLGALSAISQNLVYVYPRYDSEAENPRARWRPIDLRDADAIQHGCPSIAAVSPVVMANAKIVFGKQNKSGMIEGVWPGFMLLSDRKISTGACFTFEDIQKASKVCVIGSKIATELFGSLEAVGQTVRINRQPFTVVGILEAKGSIFGKDQDDKVLVPVTTAQQRITGGRTINLITVSARVREDIPMMKEEIRAAIRQSHKLAPNQKDDIEVLDLGALAQSFDQFLIAVTALLSAVAGISLLVGGIGIMNIMLVSVTERTREIGLRMAVGAIELDILLQFLVEAVVLSSIGGLGGVLIGLGLSAGVSTALQWPIMLSVWSVLLAVLFSAAVGIFFGIYPAWRASRLDPIVALRHE